MFCAVDSRFEMKFAPSSYRLSIAQNGHAGYGFLLIKQIINRLKKQKRYKILVVMHRNDRQKRKKVVE